jgi:electron transfer flavoprotein alpha subunit
MADGVNMNVLVIGEHDNEFLGAQTAATVGAALQISGKVIILIAGNDCAGAAQAASHLDGVNKVLLVENPALAHQLAEPMAELIALLAPEYGAVLAPASAWGKNILPRAAALLDVMQVSDIVEVVTPDTFKRPIYAGNAIQSVRSADAIKLITVRTTAFKPVGNDGQAPVETLSPHITPSRAVFLSQTSNASERPELGSAKIVVSGGRAFASRENFENLLEPLADRLGAAIGASRAAVDAGFVGNDAQVGQTGQIVAPDLYIACGISGAIQHIAGMSQSKTIVAINCDPDAPIFEIADYGLVGDIFELLPELTRAL